MEEGKSELRRHSVRDAVSNFLVTDNFLAYARDDVQFSSFFLLFPSFFIARGHLRHNYAARLRISDAPHASAMEKALPLIGKRTKGSINVGVLLKMLLLAVNVTGESSFLKQHLSPNLKIIVSVRARNFFFLLLSSENSKS